MLPISMATYVWDNVTTSVRPPGGDNDSHIKTIDKQLWVYASPFILCVGLIGNMLILLVMSRPRMRGSTTGVYLPLMAIADSGVLIVGIIPEVLEAADKVILKELHPWMCKWEKFIFYTIGDTAIWLLVAFTFDRFIAVCFPLKKRSFCTQRNAHITSVVIVLCAVAKNLHVFWTRGYVELDDGKIKQCGRPNYNFEVFVRPWIALALVSALPFVVISICNVLIIRTLCTMNKMMKQTTHGGVSRERAVHQTTAMCMSASLAFLVFISPSMVLNIGKPYWWSYDHPYANPAYSIAKSVNNQLVYVNHSINFLLYCLTGAKFRKELVDLFHSATCRKIPRSGNGSGTTVLYSSPMSHMGTPKSGHYTVNGNLDSSSVDSVQIMSKYTPTT